MVALLNVMTQKSEEKHSGFSNTEDWTVQMLRRKSLLGLLVIRSHDSPIH